MALTRVSRIAETKPVTTRDERPFCRVSGDVVSRFNKAVADMKDAEGRVGALREKVLSQGIGFLYEYNIDHPTAPVKTIDVVDDTGNATRLTSQAKYSAANPDAAEALFENLAKKYPKLEVDINDYVQETCSASFDNKIFQDSEGRFSEKIYLAYSAAIEKVTKDLVTKGILPAGVISPLKTTKKVLPLDSFDEKRYAMFASAEDQKSIREVLPNTVTLTPVT